jgi:hypothetical protein
LKSSRRRKHPCPRARARERALVPANPRICILKVPVVATTPAPASAPCRLCILEVPVTASAPAPASAPCRLCIGHCVCPGACLGACLGALPIIGTASAPVPPPATGPQPSCFIISTSCPRLSLHK